MVVVSDRNPASEKRVEKEDCWYEEEKVSGERVVRLDWWARERRRMMEYGAKSRKRSGAEGRQRHVDDA